MKSCRLLHCVRRRALTGCLWFQHSTNHCPAHCFPSAPALEFKSLHLIIKGKLPFCVMRLLKSLPCYQVPPGLWAKKPAPSSDCSLHIPGRRRSTWVWTLEAENSPCAELAARMEYSTAAGPGPETLTTADDGALDIRLVWLRERILDLS